MLGAIKSKGLNKIDNSANVRIDNSGNVRIDNSPEREEP